MTEKQLVDGLMVVVRAVEASDCAPETKGDVRHMAQVLAATRSWLDALAEEMKFLPSTIPGQGVVVFARVSHLRRIWRCIETRARRAAELVNSCVASADGGGGPQTDESREPASHRGPPPPVPQPCSIRKGL